MELDNGGKPRRTSAFDFDDAFSDGEDQDVSFHFSPSIIREDMARNSSNAGHPWAAEEGGHEASTSNGFFEVADISVSTLDINDDGQVSPSQSGSSSPRQYLDDAETSSQFVQISLSTSGLDINAEDEQPDAQEVDVPVDNNVDHSYPSVLIDASKSPSHRVTMSFDSNILPHSSSASSSSPTPSRSSSDHSSSPNAAQSTQSLPTPTPDVTEYSSNNGASTSSHSPSNSTVPPASTPMSTSNSAPESQPPLLELPSKSNGHRPTRSAGPSALEKFRSKTRPSFLPPKTRQEDDKHMADWQAMMKLSRAAGEETSYPMSYHDI